METADSQEASTCWLPAAVRGPGEAGLAARGAAESVSLGVAESETPGPLGGVDCNTPSVTYSLVHIFVEGKLISAWLSVTLGPLPGRVIVYSKGPPDTMAGQQLSWNWTRK